MRALEVSSSSSRGTVLFVDAFRNLGLSPFVESAGHSSAGAFGFASALLGFPVGAALALASSRSSTNVDNCDDDGLDDDVAADVVDVVEVMVDI